MVRVFSLLLITMSISSIVGCNEITTSGERTSAVDVVGDPRDATPDSTAQSDILGSGTPSNDESESIVHTRPAATESETSVNESDVLSEDQDVAGGNGIAKPVSLKSKKASPKLSK